MRPIGGELEAKRSEYRSLFTDSGRSSLRLFLRSFDNNKKKYLIPNFGPDIIETVLKEEGVEYSFYNVLDDLRIDYKSIEEQEFDVLYVINYFGAIHNISALDLEDKILVEDNTFFFDFENRHKVKNWYAFNSFRKISSLADGSLIKTTLEIDKEQFTHKTAPFYKIKHESKEMKYQYINHKKFSQEEYTLKCEEAEKMLDEQTNIYHMSNISLEKALLYETTYGKYVRKNRFQELYSLFVPYCINPYPHYYSFLVLSIKNRDEIQEKLREYNIHLPIHWKNSKNKLNESVLSVPLFEIYSDLEFDYMVDKLRKIIV